MKKACLICGKEFDCRNQARICPECRKAGKRICGHCGKVFVTKRKTQYLCKECDAVRAKQSCRKLEAQRLAERAREKREKRRVPSDPQHLADLAKAARELGISYGQVQCNEARTAPCVRCAMAETFALLLVLVIVISLADEL